MKDIEQDPGRRFPVVRTPRGYDAMSHLSEEEKRLGRGMIVESRVAHIEGVEQPPEHAAAQLRNPSMIYQSDPELLRAMMDDYNVLGTLVIGMNNDQVMEMTGEKGNLAKDPSVQRRYYNVHVMISKIAQEFQDDWMLQLMATLPALPLSKEQFCLLDQPGSAVWSEEERLSLEVTQAMLDRAMTDELFARADAFWGRKQFLGYVAWIAHYVFFLKVNRFNVSDAERTGDLPR